LKTICQVATVSRMGRDGKNVPGLADKLRKLREAAGLTQAGAAAQSGVHRVSIARFEAGEREPSILTLYQLAGAYGVNVCELLPGGKMPGGRKG
jgi:transcriptional regulator with XRE-family HTH domain